MGMYASDKMAEILGWQVIQTINILQDGLDDEGWPVNCCPICCDPCSALNEALDDMLLLDDLESMLFDHPYIKSGEWAYWSKKRAGLRVNKIKRMWFKEDGSHKAICAWSDGKDDSASFHKAVLKDAKKARKK